MNFIKSVFASTLGFFVALFLVFFLFIAIGIGIGASAMGSQNSLEKTKVTSNSVLEIDLSKRVKDYAPRSEDPLEQLLDLGDDKLSLNDIIEAIEKAKSDDNIKGISIKSPFINAGIAQTQAIRNKIEEFKKSGKFVFAYNDFYLQKNYYLSSVADSVFLNPIGSVDFKGLSTEILYYKDFEDKYGIKMEVIRHGKYKSAVEPYLESEMSEANREQTTSFLKSIWSEMTEDISNNRKISVENLNIIADSLFGRNTKLAKEHKLIDKTIYADEYENVLKNAVDNDDPSIISIENYIKSELAGKINVADDKIAVIYAQGNIMYGEGNENVIGQGIINDAIKDAVKDDNIKAIVLRVNSPGGSAIASELIWRELELARKKKPLVVSMGNLAASGGYYIACNANEIFAEPTTITGSIGVFGAIPNAYELSKNMGINAEQVSTNNSPNYSVFEPMDKRFYNVTKEGVEDIYKTFVNRVATGRKMTFEQVNKIAQGRVWTGKEALEKGLVDKLGSLQDAIKSAAEIAKIKDYTTQNFPVYKNDLKSALKTFPLGKAASKEEILREAMGDETYRLFKKINEMKKLKGIQARIPFTFDIK